MSRLEIVGLAGLLILVSVFLSSAAGVFKKREAMFFFLNALGAGLLTYYAFSIPNMYFAVLESVWCAGAWVSLGVNLKKTRMNGSVSRRISEKRIAE